MARKIVIWPAPVLNMPTRPVTQFGPELHALDTVRVWLDSSNLMHALWGWLESMGAGNLKTVVAPLVGTFYRSPQPGAKAFVEEGDVVDKGATVCIVEAMKIMNQVSADQGGRVAEILAKDGDWVEYQQVLMYLEPIGG